jgi:polysaccharide pyruvyl transferase WcaK-like protein
LLRGPMEEVAKTAAQRYHTMLFANKFGKKCVPGMCITRSEMLAEWLADIKKRVLQNKQELEKKSIDAQKKKLLAKRQHTQETLEEEDSYDGELAQSDSDEA